MRKAKYDLDGDKLKPYFELNNMVSGAFWMAEQLYGLTFTEITGKVPVFHQDVRVWEVKDKASGKYVGLFYGDYFARAGKRSGAWAQGYQRHEAFTGKTLTADHVQQQQLRARRGRASRCSSRSTTPRRCSTSSATRCTASCRRSTTRGCRSRRATSSSIPSQVHEQWVLSRPVLDRFAKHYKTGKPMPQALVKKVDASSKFNQGYGTVEYLSSAIVDMELHTKADGVIDADAFERETLERIGAPREVAMRHRLPQFNHLFTSDSYSAGYYSYLWSEVMDADTREAFAEAGNVFDKATADKMRKFILSPGNTTDRAEAYRQFRGRDPDVKALLKKRGFPPAD